MSLALSRPLLYGFLLLASVASLLVGVSMAVTPPLLALAFGDAFPLGSLVYGLGWVGAGAIGSLQLQALARIALDLGEIRARVEGET